MGRPAAGSELKDAPKAVEAARGGDDCRACATNCAAEGRGGGVSGGRGGGLLGGAAGGGWGVNWVQLGWRGGGVGSSGWSWRWWVPHCSGVWNGMEGMWGSD